MTLIEVLITVAIGGFLLILSGQVVNSAASIQSREELTVPVQESVRGAMEVMSTELREAITPRVLGAYAATPSGLAAYTSTSTAVTITVGDVNGAFGLAKPSGFPATTGYTSRSAVNVSTPNASGTLCSNQLKSGDYFILLSRPVGALVTDPLTVSWGQVAPSACVAGVINTTSSMPSIGQWTVDSKVVESKITRYYLGSVNGVNVLYRQTINGAAAGTAQVVAFDITDLKIEYSNDGQTFDTTPSTTLEPLAVRLTITGKSGQSRAGVTSIRPYVLTQVVFMRQTTLVKTF